MHFKLADVLLPKIIVTILTSTSANLTFLQPPHSLSVDKYTVTLTSTSRSGIPTIRTESTTSNSIIINNLEIGIQYSARVIAMNSMAELTATTTIILTTSSTGENYSY